MIVHRGSSTCITILGISHFFEVHAAGKYIFEVYGYELSRQMKPDTNVLEHAVAFPVNDMTSQVSLVGWFILQVPIDSA